MVSIIASIVIAISVLVATLITFTPNVKVIMENDFMRSAKNNAYLYGWEWGQLNYRTGNLDSTKPTVNTDSEFLTKKNANIQQSLQDKITYDAGTIAKPNLNPLTIEVETPYQSGSNTQP